MNRPAVVVLCGGRSAERLVSLVSAQCVLAHIDPRRFRARLVHVGRDGSWAEVRPERLLAQTPEALHSSSAAQRRLRAGARALNPWALLGSLRPQDCVFPVLHGPMGEDGTLQGLLELARVAYVGCGVLGSAAGMDKEATKRIAAHAGLPQVPWAVARAPRDAAAAARRLGFPVFIKPARMGSSVGVTKVTGPAGVAAALRAALRYDDKALVEKGIPAREIEAAMLGDPWAPDHDRLALRVSVVGEIVPNADFYDYTSKYLDPEGARLLVPAPLPARAAARVRALALRAFRALDLYGLARIDFFAHRRTGALYFNEANTLPGFTPGSMYPRLWRESGVPTRRLIETLIALAHRRERSRRRLSLDPDLGRTERTARPDVMINKGKMDAQTFAGLIARAGDKAYNFAYRLSGNEPDARDLVQEAFSRALEHFGAYDEARPFDSWLLRILHNVFLDGMRRHSHTRTMSLDAPAPVEETVWTELLPADEPSPVDELVRRESVDLLQRALARLPTTYRSAVALCDIEGLAYEEIAEVMEVPVGTVRSRIHQGRVLLRKAYEELEQNGGGRS